MPNNKKSKYSIRRLMRTMVVLVVYEYELLDKKIDSKEVFELDTFNQLFNYEVFEKPNEIYKEQIKIISIIEKNYDIFKKVISKYIRQDWTWKRIDPLIRAILLCACVELWKLDIGIITNEYVEISKDFIPDDESYKFINIVIEKIGNEYNELRKK